MSLSEFITVIQLAERLMIPRATAYYLVQRGKIPGAFRVGKHWRLKRAIVDQWIETETSRPPASPAPETKENAAP